MIKIIAGEKGSGKTATLVESINAVATKDNNVVCIERGNRLDQLLKQNIKLMKEFPYLHGMKIGFQRTKKQ